MTAIIYFGEMLVASLLAIALLAISRLPMSSDAVLFAGGVIAWTLAEYIAHRFVLHGFAPTEHRLHHANPDEAVITIFWQIWICFALAFLIVGGAFVSGALVAYPSACFALHLSIPLSDDNGRFTGFFGQVAGLPRNLATGCWIPNLLINPQWFGDCICRSNCPCNQSCSLDQVMTNGPGSVKRSIDSTFA